MLTGCRRGERTAQAALYRALAPRLLGVCRRYARTREAAEDLLQESFLKLFHRLDQYQGAGSLEGWARRVCVSTCIDHYRAELRQWREIELEEATDLPPADASILADLDAQDLLMLINRLPDGYRLVLNLYCLEGYSHKEIAQLLGIEERTSSSQLFKARRLLAALVRHAELPRRPTQLTF